MSTLRRSYSLLLVLLLWELLPRLGLATAVGVLTGLIIATHRRTREALHSHSPWDGLA